MIHLIEIVKLVEKQKWANRFCKSYDGELHPLTSALYGPSSKYLVAVNDKKEVGYMRICRTDEFDRYTCEQVWIVQEAYVKPAYRSRGVLREMITLSVKEYGVKALFIETCRFEKLVSYYSSLGFTAICAVQDPLMAHVVHCSFERVISAANDDFLREAA